MSAAAVEDGVLFAPFHSLPLPSSISPQLEDVVNRVGMMLQTSMSAEDGFVVDSSITDNQSESYNTGPPPAAAAQVDVHQHADVSDELDCSFTETDLDFDIMDLPWFSDL